MDVPIANEMEKRAAFERQQAMWHDIVKHLAEEFSCPISEVGNLLSTTTNQLEQEARIKDFIQVLAIKQVKDLLSPYHHRPPRHEQRDLTHP
ncbi:MAG: DUF3562 domain-containing protein [Nitrospira sp.]|nr:MAG: DUF3562 domain-containing protein [Nitrospira sp.]